MSRTKKSPIAAEWEDEPIIEGVHLPDSYVAWPDEVAGPWELALHWQVIEGRAECIGYTLVSAKPDDQRSRHLRKIGTPITAALVRKLKIGHFINECRAVHEQLMPDETIFQPKGIANPRSSPHRLKEIAEVYRAARSKGIPTTRAIQDAFHVSSSNARKLVSAARKAGYLPPTRQGVPR